MVNRPARKSGRIMVAFPNIHVASSNFCTSLGSEWYFYLVDWYSSSPLDFSVVPHSPTGGIETLA